MLKIYPAIAMAMAKIKSGRFILGRKVRKARDGKEGNVEKEQRKRRSGWDVRRPTPLRPGRSGRSLSRSGSG